MEPAARSGYIPYSNTPFDWKLGDMRGRLSIDMSMIVSTPSQSNSNSIAIIMYLIKRRYEYMYLKFRSYPLEIETEKNIYSTIFVSKKKPRYKISIMQLLDNPDQYKQYALHIDIIILIIKNNKFLLQKKTNKKHSEIL